MVRFTRSHIVGVLTIDYLRGKVVFSFKYDPSPAWTLLCDLEYASLQLEREDYKWWRRVKMVESIDGSGILIRRSKT